MSRAEPSLLDIAQAARPILAFKEGMDKATFLGNPVPRLWSRFKIKSTGEARKEI